MFCLLICAKCAELAPSVLLNAPNALFFALICIVCLFCPVHFVIKTVIVVTYSMCKTLKEVICFLYVYMLMREMRNIKMFQE